MSSNAVRVLNTQRRQINVTEVRSSDGVVTAVLPSIEPGGYVVTWRVESDDSHPIGGAFTFGVGEGAVLPNASPYIAQSGASRAVGVALGFARALQFVSLLVMAGVVSIARMRWLEGLLWRPLGRVVMVSGAIGAFSALVGIALQAANLRGGGLGDAIRPTAWRNVVDTRFGQAWLLRSALALGVVVVVAVSRRAGDRFIASPLINGLVAAALIGIALSVINPGHAATGRWPAVAKIADGVHLASAALWVGGLVIIALRARHDSLRSDQARAFVNWFSQVALVCVALLAVTGAVQGVRQSGNSLSDFVASAYGRLLLAKVLVVLGIVAVARHSRRIVRRRGALAGRVGRAVQFELALIVGVLAITAVLVDATPPRVAVSSGPILTQATIGKYVVEIGVEPARVGATEMHLTFYEQGNFSTVQPRVDDVRAALSEPQQGVGPLAVNLLRGGPAHFISNGLVIPLKGKWDLTITVRTGEFNEDQGTVALTIR